MLPSLIAAGATSLWQTYSMYASAAAICRTKHTCRTAGCAARGAFCSRQHHLRHLWWLTPIHHQPLCTGNSLLSEHGLDGPRLPHAAAMSDVGYVCCRVAVDPPMLWAQGMNSCLAFGLTALTAYTQAGHGRVRDTWPSLLMLPRGKQSCVISMCYIRTHSSARALVLHH